MNLKQHKLALIFFIIVGIISVAPHLAFRVSLGEKYRGIYMMQTANELEYLSRIQEIRDGHLLLGSVPFFEYKENPPLVPPNILEILLALLSGFFNMSIQTALIISKFFLPAILFVLIYFLVSSLTLNKESSSNKINATAASLLIVLGYDLVDYRTVMNYFLRLSSPNDFLLWTRPINPILGGILIYSFLLLLWELYKDQQTKSRVAKKVFVILCGIVFGMAVTSYFFSWGIILSLVGIFIIFSLLKSRYKFIKDLFLICFIGLIMALPYLYNIFSVFGSSLYKEASIRTGLMEGHQPILNKFLILSIIIFFIFNLFKLKELRHKDWFLFSLALILAGLVALNQQIITGVTIWPFHFVQYTIPLSLTALFVVSYNSIQKKYPRIWLGIVVIFIAVSLFFGTYTQASTYRQSYSYYKQIQQVDSVFNWINKNTQKDCVILSRDHEFLNRAVLVYTHCNVYLSSFNTYLIPFERLYSGYLVMLGLEGIEKEEIEEYIEKNGLVGAVYLFNTEGLLHGGSSTLFKKIKDNIIIDYKSMDLGKEIRKYKVDYYMTTSIKEQNKAESDLIKNLEKVYSSDEISIYKF